MPSTVPSSPMAGIKQQLGLDKVLVELSEERGVILGSKQAADGRRGRGRHALGRVRARPASRRVVFR